jgi:hypothetical protein
LLVGLALAVTAVALGAADKPVNVSLSGTSVWTGGVDNYPTFSSAALQGTFVDVAGSASKLRSGSYDGTVTRTGDWDVTATNCSEYGPHSRAVAPASGTVNLVTKSGTIMTAALPGSVVCAADNGAHDQWFTFKLNLEITGGTKSYARATGSLALTIRSDIFFFNGEPPTPPADFGTVSGTISR